MSTPETLNIRALRLQAKEMRKASDLTHCEALNVLAKQRGFDTWMRLLDAHAGQAAQANRGVAA